MLHAKHLPCPGAGKPERDDCVELRERRRRESYGLRVTHERRERGWCGGREERGHYCGSRGQAEGVADGGERGKGDSWRSWRCGLKSDKEVNIRHILSMIIRTSN